MAVAPLERKLADLLGGRTASVLEKAFGMVTAGDLLTHYPRRYAKRGELTSLAELPEGENVTIVAEVRRATERKMQSRRGSVLEVVISDGNGMLTLTFFNQAWREKDLRPGVRGIFAGKVGRYRGLAQLAHPDYELFPDDAAPLAGGIAKEWTDAPVPIYPATSTMPSWKIQQAVELVLDAVGRVDDPVPDDVRRERGLVSYAAALNGIHHPAKDVDWKRARDALRFQEAFVLQTALLEQRMAARSVPTTSRRAIGGADRERFDDALPFDLTLDQQRVGEEIARDLEAEFPMNRLVQGEVGSGKTLVALRAMLQVSDAGGQAALLAPTEVLAAQHLRSIVRSLGPDLAAKLMPTLITGQMSTAERKKALLRVVTGQARIVVGTHALMGDKVTFFDLGLVVVDEQHRFGVEQREALRAKGSTPPHVLVLTATPIPRTVAMTVFGDLDVSVIRELPVGRAGIESFVVALADHPGWINRAWQRAAEEIEKGRQVFVVCPAIDDVSVEADTDLVDDEPADGDARPAPRASVEATMKLLPQVEALKGRRIAALHGRMSADEKDDIMRAFAAGSIDMLVSTTVIEVGVDVPNASMMIVLDADRFGVSQLHQLRGRVGRGGLPGLCLLVTTSPAESVARERVDVVASTTDGFDLAQADLELRREGDVLGTSQSGGRSSLRLLRVVADAELIGEAREAASSLLDSDPILASHPALRGAIERRLDDQSREFLAKN
ncbi:ATP-dependent DNA helicase RecG [Herbiconiux sp. L3-i23]|uniref:ATP-dependent DNA helicase RecG n=1 Tax=Herbiconiux sp. L3-i23 TaxID=2905871 RepID=UPI00204BABF2|nr:ATP-dependent DNA helicase RecG [Herbiconiux sp. L3-i23]BDI21834.1 ATP-dependent DNA helicase RecG [Herbiconiux sp. L3-i23]